MASGQTARLQQIAATFQRRWGSKVLQRGMSTASIAAHPPFSTGHPPLDGLFGGGLPRGGISEFPGQSSSGMTSVAPRTIARAQASGSHALYVDLSHTFDPFYAARYGVDLAHLILVRPRNTGEMLAIGSDTMAEEGAALLVVSAGGGPGGAALPGAVPARLYLTSYLQDHPRALPGERDSRRPAGACSFGVGSGCERVARSWATGPRRCCCIAGQARPGQPSPLRSACDRLPPARPFCRRHPAAGAARPPRAPASLIEPIHHYVEL